MDKNAIKTFATLGTRRVDRPRVSQKAEQYGVTEKNPGDPSDQSVHGLLTPKEQAQRTEPHRSSQGKRVAANDGRGGHTWFNVSALSDTWR